jgi:hypothetical protein
MLDLYKRTKTLEFYEVILEFLCLKMEVKIHIYIFIIIV